MTARAYPNYPAFGIIADNASLVLVRSPWGAPGHIVRVTLDGTTTLLAKEAALYRTPMMSGKRIAVKGM